MTNNPNDQLSLFALDESEDTSNLFGATKQDLQSEISFFNWTYFRNSLMASYEEKKSQLIWLDLSTPSSSKSPGNCACLEFSKSGNCTHTKNLKLWAKSKGLSPATGLTQKFKNSQYNGLAQNWFKEWGELSFKVRRPSVLEFFDAQGILRIEFKAANLGAILQEDFYGLLCFLDEEAWRKLRIPGEVKPMDWQLFFNQNLDSTELNLKAQNMSTLTMLFEHSLIASLMRHSLVFFEESGQNPAQLQLEYQGLSINFTP